MDQGKAVESGSHDELIEKANGRYKELYDMQYASLASSSELWRHSSKF